MNLNCEQNDYQILGHLKDKNIKEGACVCTGRAGQKHCATNCHDSYCSLNKPSHSSHLEVSTETWSMRGD